MNKGQRKGNGCRTFWSLLLSVLWVAGGGTALGRARGLGADQVRPTITLLVFNYAAIDERRLVEAEKEASRVFDRAGVTLSWHACGGTGQPVSDLACASDDDPRMIKVRLVKRILDGSHLTDDGTLGFAVGQMATVSYVRAQEISNAEIENVECLLGYAMAHELGHVLMPGRPHTADGIMRADWDTVDLSRISQGSLSFRADEKALIRAEAKRMGGAGAVVSIASHH